MNKVELDTMEHIQDVSRRLSEISDNWDISYGYKSLVKFEEEIDCNNHEYSGEARTFFRKSLDELKSELKRKVLAMIHEEEEPLPSPEEVDKEEGQF